MSKELMKEKIEKAQCEIERKKNTIKNGAMRQHYHFMPQTGWLNDPNGLIYYKDKYHFFFQCNPYSGFWDSMHWGHAISEDMIHWEYLPIALAPSEDYDNHPKGGCFSGSAIEYDNKLYLMYTGSTNTGSGYQQSQCIAYSSDGIHFEKYVGNPVVIAPEGIKKDCFRDPKVWKHENMYYMVCGATFGERAQALLYRSKDMVHWEFFNVLAESYGEWGYMWECPDFYQLEDKFVLMFSPMGVGEHTSVYLVGDFDYATGKFNYSVSNEIDWGFDYYAPQSFLSPDGRRIIVGWSNEWEWMPSWKDWGPTFKEGWCGFFNIPRQVCLMPDNTLQFVPIRELELIRSNPCKEDTILIKEEQTDLSAGDGISFEMKFDIDLKNSDAEQIEINFRVNHERKTTFVLNLKMGVMTVNRNNADGWSRGISKSTICLKGRDSLDIHVFSDQSSLEIFTNQYRNNHSNNIFADSLQSAITIRTYGGNAIIRNYESYGLLECFK